MHEGVHYYQAALSFANEDPIRQHYYDSGANEGLGFYPALGWFFADNLELSAILSISNIRAGGMSSTLWSGLFEPSYHLPFNRSMFAFAVQYQRPRP